MWPGTDTSKCASVQRGCELFAKGRFEPDAQCKDVAKACENGEGIGEDGRVIWRGGNARYVYVLEAGSSNPGVPPNLDLPEGTVWRLDVAASAEPIQSGIGYGAQAEGASQRFPESGSPKALIAGQAYHLYVLADISLPITRCLFTYGG